MRFRVIQIWLIAILLKILNKFYSSHTDLNLKEIIIDITVINMFLCSIPKSIKSVKSVSIIS